MAGEKVLGSLRREMTLRRMVLREAGQGALGVRPHRRPGCGLPDVLGGVPPLRGQLPALGVIDRGVQDGDADVPCLRGGVSMGPPGRPSLPHPVRALLTS